MPTQAEISLNPTSTKGAILTSNQSSRSSFTAGTNGQIISVQSSATSGLEYKTFGTSSPAFELIASSTLTTSTSSVIFSSIDTTYTSYKLIVQFRMTASPDVYAYIRFNSVTASGSYKSGGWLSSNSSTNIAFSYNDAERQYLSLYGISTDTSGYNVSEYDIFPKASGMSTRNIQYFFKHMGWYSTLGTAGLAEHLWGVGKCVSATSEMTSITVGAWTGTADSSFSSGTSIYLYGFRR